MLSRLGSLIARSPARAAAAATAASGAGLSRPADPHGDRLPGRRTDRFRRPPDRRQAQGHARPGHHREQAGRQRRDRRRLRGEVARPTATRCSSPRSARSPSRRTCAPTCPTTRCATSRRSPWWCATPRCWWCAPTARSRRPRNSSRWRRPRTAICRSPRPASARPRISRSSCLRPPAGFKFVHVPYRGAAPALTDLLGGQVQAAFFADAPVLMPQITGGKVRPLGAASDQPQSDAAGRADAGRTGLSRTPRPDNWYGLLAPAKTPPAIIAKLNDAFVAGDQRSGGEGEADRVRRRAGGRHAGAIRQDPQGRACAAGARSCARRASRSRADGSASR